MIIETFPIRWVKNVFFLAILLVFCGGVRAQTVIHMEESNGVFQIPCKVNQLALNFIFDTGASNICISITEALFMLKNGYLDDEDILYTEYYQIANGEIEEGTKIILKEVAIGNVIIRNVEATVVHYLDAPLLLGQSAISKLGEIEFNYNDQTLTLKDAPNDVIYVHSDKPDEDNVMFMTYFINPEGLNILYMESSSESEIIYNCPNNAKVSVLKNEGVFFKVQVNGYVGYVSRDLLERKW